MHRKTVSQKADYLFWMMQVLLCLNLRAPGFEEHTFVETPEGPREIQNIKRGDYVLSMNEAGQVVRSKVAFRLLFCCHDVVTLYAGDCFLAMATDQLVFNVLASEYQPADQMDQQEVMVAPYQRDRARSHPRGGAPKKSPEAFMRHIEGFAECRRVNVVPREGLFLLHYLALEGDCQTYFVAGPYSLKKSILVHNDFKKAAEIIKATMEAIASNPDYLAIAVKAVGSAIVLGVIIRELYYVYNYGWHYRENAKKAEMKQKEQEEKELEKNAEKFQNALFAVENEKHQSELGKINNAKAREAAKAENASWSKSALIAVAASALLVGGVATGAAPASWVAFLGKGFSVASAMSVVAKMKGLVSGASDVANNINANPAVNLLKFGKDGSELCTHYKDYTSLAGKSADDVYKKVEGLESALSEHVKKLIAEDSACKEAYAKTSRELGEMIQSFGKKRDLSGQELEKIGNKVSEFTDVIVPKLSTYLER